MSTVERVPQSFQGILLQVFDTSLKISVSQTTETNSS